MKEMQDLNERLEAEKRTLSRNLDRLKVNISSGPLDYDSDGGGADGSQSDMGGGISPAARRRQMMKKNGLKSGGDVPSENDGHRGLWARIRNKKDNKSNHPVEIYQRQGKNRRSSHLPAEQGEGRRSGKSRSGGGEDYSGSEGSDGGEIYNEDDLGEQMMTSESYSDSDTRESEQHTSSRTLKNSRSGGGGNSAAESEALAAARAQLASQAEAAIAQAKEMADLAGANDDLRRKVASLEKENKELKVLLCGVVVFGKTKLEKKNRYYIYPFYKCVYVCGA
jgi:cell division protein FtsB